MTAGLKIKEQVSLAPMTTFRVGGSARYFAEVENESELSEALDFAEAQGLPIFILGGGSNILVSDAGFNGLVIRIAMKGISLMDVPGREDTALVTARAGEDWDEFVEWCVANELAGLECLSGIPGLVGGTPIQNVGAYGQEVSETIVSVRVLDLEDRLVKDIAGSECGFAYRSSIFNTTAKDRYVVLAVTYELRKGGKPAIAYPDLIRVFRDFDPSLAEMRSAVCSIRASKGMMAKQGGADSHSAGSFFKNPVVARDEFEEIERRAALLAVAGEGSPVPHFDVPGGGVKIPAAWLIEKSGFAKGYLKGNAGLSNLHTLALTNRGGASADEVLCLKKEIVERVEELFGVRLVQEPALIGFD
ncbi:MAG: UDP-N-acetylmuramate dehydrogenase [Acidobacteriota bacterium]|nr:MAG: UDP-N-acetylmuramate dehydrogenase [Acidobacteriota bacterium]